MENSCEMEVVRAVSVLTRWLGFSFARIYLFFAPVAGWIEMFDVRLFPRTFCISAGPQAGDAVFNRSFQRSSQYGQVGCSTRVKIRSRILSPIFFNRFRHFLAATAKPVWLSSTEISQNLFNLLLCSKVHIRRLASHRPKERIFIAFFWQLINLDRIRIRG